MLTKNYKKVYIEAVKGNKESFQRCYGRRHYRTRKTTEVTVMKKFSICLLCLFVFLSMNVGLAENNTITLDDVTMYART